MCCFMKKWLSLPKYLDLLELITLENMVLEKIIVREENHGLALKSLKP